MPPILDDVRIAPAVPPYTYLGIAQSMIGGVKILADASPSSALALSLVAAHVLECTLKAYLSRDGDDTKLRAQSVRHNLNTLWGMAHADGLSIPQAPLNWVDNLSRLHDHPYYLRYSTGKHGILSPSAEPMSSELSSLITLVQNSLHT
jgi:hypothetical protein